MNNKIIKRYLKNGLEASMYVSTPLREIYIKHIIKKNGFWFINIPKTSTTAITEELYRQVGSVYRKYNYRNYLEKLYVSHSLLRRDHIRADEMKIFIGPENWERLFTFAIVRNPWDRVVSFYNFFHREFNPRDNNITFKDFVIELEYYFTNGKILVKNKTNYDFISDENKIIVDYVGFYEKREEAMQYISNKLGFEIGNKILNTANIKQKKHYSEYYDKQTKNIVEKIHRKDIENFGYTFEG